MQEPPKKIFLDKVWVALYFSGMIFTPLISIAIIFNLSIKHQPLLALLSSISWIINAFLHNRMLNKSDKLQNYHFRYLWAGIFQVVFAILFWTVIKPGTEIALWVINFNMLFGVLSFFILYVGVIFSLFPGLSTKLPKEQDPKPDPLNDLPKNLRDLANTGKETVGVTTIKFTATCAILILISTFFLGNASAPLTFLGIETLASIIVILIARYFAAYKWQQQATRSGIPEKKLKSAAKLAGLPWINIKKE